MKVRILVEMIERKIYDGAVPKGSDLPPSAGKSEDRQRTMLSALPYVCRSPFIFFTNLVGAPLLQ